MTESTFPEEKEKYMPEANEDIQKTGHFLPTALTW